MQYTPEQIDTILNARLRHPRATPWPAIYPMVGLTYEGDNDTRLERVVWGVATGYGEKCPDDPDKRMRLWYQPTEVRVCRHGLPWTAEDARLLALARGEGQLRVPPVDAAYVARVLARRTSEVEAKWDPLGRKGFGLGT